MLWHFCQGLHYCTRPVGGPFSVPVGQQFTVAIYARTFTCACSLTVLVFFPSLLTPYYYYYYHYYYYYYYCHPYFSAELLVQCDRCLG